MVLKNINAIVKNCTVVEYQYEHLIGKDVEVVCQLDDEWHVVKYEDKYFIVSRSDFDESSYSPTYWEELPVIERRLCNSEKSTHIYYYDIRHAIDDCHRPSIIEEKSLNEFWGTLCSPFKIEFRGRDYITIKEYYDLYMDKCMDVYSIEIETKGNLNLRGLWHKAGTLLDDIQDSSVEDAGVVKVPATRNIIKASKMISPLLPPDKGHMIGIEFLKTGERYVLQQSRVGYSLIKD